MFRGSFVVGALVLLFGQRPCWGSEPSSGPRVSRPGLTPQRRDIGRRNGGGRARVGSARCGPAGSGDWRCLPLVRREDRVPRPRAAEPPEPGGGRRSMAQRWQPSRAGCCSPRRVEPDRCRIIQDTNWASFSPTSWARSSCFSPPRVGCWARSRCRPRVNRTPYPD